MTELEKALKDGIRGANFEPGYRTKNGCPATIDKARVYAGLDPSIDIIPSKKDPIAQKLPINMVLGAFILRGDMHTDPEQWLLLKEYKKK